MPSPPMWRYMWLRTSFNVSTKRLTRRHSWEWFRTGQITTLTQVRRTSHQGLLDAALALREGRTLPSSGPGLKISNEYRNQMPFAIGRALHNAQRAGGSVAMIVAPGTTTWVEGLLPRLRQGLQTSHQTVPPLRIEREMPINDDITRVFVSLGNDPVIQTDAAVRLLLGVTDAPIWLPQVTAALTHQQRVCAVQEWSLDAIRKLIDRKANLHRAYGYQRQSGIPVITIQSAKNWQFNNVVVLWGAGVNGDAQRKARRFITPSLELNPAVRCLFRPSNFCLDHRFTRFRRPVVSHFDCGGCLNLAEP